jgi:hypothetical protein
MTAPPAGKSIARVRTGQYAIRRGGSTEEQERDGQDKVKE